MESFLRKKIQISYKLQIRRKVEIFIKSKLVRLIKDINLIRPKMIDIHRHLKQLETKQ